MDAIDIYNRLLYKQPFCFIKFNDGEYNILRNNGDASRGETNYSPFLKDKLLDCLSFHHGDYHCGIPCVNCFSEAHHFCKQIRKDNVLATILINDNVEKTLLVLKESLPKYENIYLVCNKEAKYNRLNNIDFNNVFLVGKDGFDEVYNSLIDFEFPPGSLILLCCGPFGRIMAVEWFKKNNNCTFLELGSLFDPIFHNKFLLYHTGGLYKCDICYKTPSNAFLEHINSDSYIEHYYSSIRNRISYDNWGSLSLYFRVKSMEYENDLLLGLTGKKPLMEVHNKYKDKCEAGFYMYEKTYNWKLLMELVERLNNGATAHNEFENDDVYKWGIHYLISINAYYNDKDKGKPACEFVLNSCAPDYVKNNVKNNLGFYP